MWRMFKVVIKGRTSGMPSSPSSQHGSTGHSNTIFLATLAVTVLARLRMLCMTLLLLLLLRCSTTGRWLSGSPGGSPASKSSAHLSEKAQEARELRRHTWPTLPQSSYLKELPDFCILTRSLPFGCTPTTPAAISAG